MAFKQKPASEPVKMSLLPLFLVVSTVAAVCCGPELLILHDKSFNEFDPVHDWVGKFSLLIRDVQMRYPTLKVSSGVNLGAMAEPSFYVDAKRDPVGFIIIARCQRARTLAVACKQIYPDVSFLRIDTEYCKDPNTLLFTCLKVDLPCFMLVFQDWLSKLPIGVRSLNSFETKHVEHSIKRDSCHLCKFHKPSSTHLVDVYHGKYRRNILSGQEIRLGAIQSPLSIITLDENENVLKFEGVLFDHMEALAQTLNYTFRLIVTKEQTSGTKLANGKKEFELSAMAYFLVYQWSEVIDWIYAAFDNPLILMTPLPKTMNSNNWLASVQPYSYQVWLLILSSLVVLALITYFLDLIVSKMVANSTHLLSWHSNIFYSLAVILNQGRSDGINQHSTRILFGAWCLTTVILINLYTSVLIGYLTLPQVRPVIRSFEDLAHSSRIRMAFLPNSPVATLFMDPNATGNYAIIRDRAKSHPEDFVASRAEALDKVASTGIHVCADAIPSLYAMLAQDYKTHGECRVGVVHDIFYTAAITYATPKDSPYWHFFYMGLERIVETGVWNKLNQKLKIRNPCTDKPVSIPASKKLGLSDLVSPFALFGIGVILALVALGLEILSRKPPCAFRHRV